MQAEAVADLIDASSEAAARAALRSLQGEFSARVRALDEALAQLRAHVEATIDFPTDEIDFLADAQLLARLAAVRAQCASLQAVAQQGRLLTEGLTVVIAGAPTAGKSTLLNRLAGQDAAIVSEQPGTTRDVLREHIQIEGVPVLLLDTAGLRHSTMHRAEAAPGAEPPATGRPRAVLVDAAADPQASVSRSGAPAPAGVPLTLVYSKIDLLPAAAAFVRMGGADVAGAVGAGAPASTHCACTCRTRGISGGIPAPLSAPPAPPGAGRDGATGRACSVAARRGLVAEGCETRSRLWEKCWAGAADELLGRIFASFCIGK